MKVKIYQINQDRDEKHTKFQGLMELHARKETVDPARYDMVFDGDLPAQCLEDIFVLCNRDVRPEGFTGHSLSVSDVIAVEDGNRIVPPGAYYCDNWGWSKLQEFDFKEEMR